MLWLCGPVWGALLLLTACGSEPDPEAADDVQEEYEVPTRRSRLALGDLPPMPDYPDSILGHVVAVSAGDFPIDGAWPAEAWICPSVGTIELYTEDLQNGTGILLHFPDSQAVGTYTVLPADTGFSDERVARIGVQVFRETQNDAFGFRAIDGHIEISEADDHLSGKFQTTLRETQIEILTRYAGALFRIPLKILSDEYCTSLSDSLHMRPTEPDTVAADSADEVAGS
jgi:hypothetical protein